MPPRGKRAPAWSNGELMDLISVWGEESVQAQLRSSRKNYDTFAQVSRAMLERGHERDALQCRVKVKELRSAYRKAHEGNRRSGAAPTTCRFYKELDATYGGDPSVNPRTTMDSSEPVEEGEGEADSEATVVGEDTPESQEACSQELFSSQEEASQSQPLELGAEESQEQVPVTLTSPGPVLSVTERKIQNLRRKPNKSKEDLVKAVMNQCATENKTAQEWREKMQHWKETESRRKALTLKKTTRQLINLMARQTDCMHSLVAMQAEHYRAKPPPSQTSFPYAPMSAPSPVPQHPGSYLHHHQLPPTPVPSPMSPENYDSYPLHSTPITMQQYNPEVNSTPGSTYEKL